MGSGLSSLLKVDIPTNFRCILLFALFYLLSTTAIQSEHILVWNSRSAENDQQCKNFSAVRFAEEQKTITMHTTK